MYKTEKTEVTMKILHLFLLLGLLAVLIVVKWILCWRLDILEFAMPSLYAFTITWFVLLVFSLIPLFLFLIIYKEDNNEL